MRVKIHPIVFSTLFLLIYITTAPLHTQEKKNIYIIHNVAHVSPAFSEFSNFFINKILLQDEFRIHTFQIHLGYSGFMSAGQRKEAYADLVAKFKKHKPDIIISISPETNNFLSHYLDDSFISNSKIISYSPDQKYIMKHKNRNNIYIVNSLITTDVTKTLELIPALLPHTEKVIIIAGIEQFSAYIVTLIKEYYSHHNLNYNIEYWVGYPLEEIIRKAGGQDNIAAILFVGINTDRNGSFYSYPTVIKIMQQKAGFPVFSFHQSLMGYGIAGGYMMDNEAISEKIFQLSMDLLKNKNTEKISDIPFAYQFDYRVLKKWNIDEKKLPAGSHVLYKDFSIWDFYKYYIISVFVIVAILFFLVTFLLIINNKHKKTKLKFKLLIENITSVAWETNQQGKTKYISPNVKKIYGYSQQEIYEQGDDTWINNIHPDDVDYVLKSFDDFINKKSKMFDVQYRIKRKDGKWIWLKDSSDYLIKSKNETIAYGVFTDITAQKKLEESLRDSEERYKLLSDLNKEGVLLHRNSIAFEVNKALCTIFGYSKEELINKYIIDKLFTPDSMKIIEENRLRKEPVPIELIGIRKNGKKVVIIAEGRNFMYKGKNTSIAIVKDITEKKEAQKALKEKETLYQNMFSGSRDGICFIDTTGKFLDCNKALLRMLGYTKDELVNKSFYDITPEKWHAWEQSEILEKQLPDKGFSEIYEKEYIRKDGTIFPVQVIAYRLDNIDGSTKMYWATIRDISERLQAEETIRYQANLVRTVTDAIISTDLKFNIISWNKAAEKIYGWKEEEVKGKSIFDLTGIVYPSDYQRENNLRKFFKNGYWHGEIIQKHKNGSPINIFASVTLLRDSEGDPYGVVGLNKDITELKKAEKIVLEKTSQFEDICNSVPGVIYQFFSDKDNNYSMSYLSKNAEIIFGRPLSDLLDPNQMLASIHPDDIEGFLASIKESKKNLTKWMHTYRVIMEDGTFIWIRGISNPRKQADGSVLWNGVLFDITMQKKLEEEKRVKDMMLLRAERLASLGTLSSAIAHEIRQPLQLIKIIGDTILFSIKNDKEYAKRHGELLVKILDISSAVHRINNIIEHLQTLIKKSRRNKKEVNSVNSLIVQITDLFKQKLRNHCIELETKLDQCIDSFKIPSIPFEQVLSNLLNNAIEALDAVEIKHKKIIISTRNNQNHIELFVIDNGPGIDDGKKEKIFDPLFSTKDKTDSMGMGLFIVHNILDSLDSIIEVMDNKPSGAIFKIILSKRV